jgi:hypothetical protein
LTTMATACRMEKSQLSHQMRYHWDAGRPFGTEPKQDRVIALTQNDLKTFISTAKPRPAFSREIFPVKWPKR